MSEFLFGEFESVSAKEWKQKIQVDLKGDDYNKSLIWQSEEGIHVKPFYHQDDFEKDFAPIPGHPDNWNIGQHIFIDDEVIANKLALDAIERGAEVVYFTSEKEFNISRVFQDFPFENSIYFDFKFLSEDFIQQLKQFFLEKKAKVFYNIDIIGNLARSGNWFYNLTEDHKILNKILQKNSSGNIISVDLGLYQNAGANMVQQLGYALAHANEYLNFIVYKNQIDVTSSTVDKSLTLTFNLAVGSNYFFEIAKIRALRKLYAALALEYGFSENCHIIAIPSKRNKTLYDYNVNMLRTTTECMSAILGGANTVSNTPYDSIYHKSNEFAERIARNQLHILKKESYFETAGNPADGTYYIESLTNQLSEKALELFKEIETQGGFLKQLKEGLIQRKIKDSAKKEQELFNTGELKLLGTNFHIHKNDKMKEDLELYPFVKTNVRKTLINPIIEKRLSEKIEQERLNLES